MMRGVWPLLIESALILLQTVPTHIDVDVLQKKLLERIDGILDVHDFHVWQLTGDRIIASAHVRCLNISEYMKVVNNLANPAIKVTMIQFIRLRKTSKNFSTTKEFILLQSSQNLLTPTIQRVMMVTKAIVWSFVPKN